jgi:RNA polymerase sigma-70 factor (ECF subfamily)
MPSNDQQGAAGSPGRGRDAFDPGDEILVRRARDGDPAAFDQLVRRHQDAVHGLVRRMVGEAEAARELTQDAFIRAWRGLGSFREEARFSTWIFRIAVNLCLDHRGSRHERERRVETSLASPELERRPLASPEPGPAEKLEERELAAALQAALEDLDPAHRAAFLLRHQEGLSPAEIAEVLSISESNAKVRVHRAREAILQEMRRRGHGV